MASAKGTGGASVLTGLIVAVAAVVPLVLASASAGTDQPDAGSPAENIVDVVSTTVAPPAVVSETIVVVPEPVEVDGLPESVVRALEAEGNVRREGIGELALPASVVNVLADNDVVLRVAEEPSP
jgi:hypothetical protein